MQTTDPRLEAKKKVLTELRAMARAKVAEGLKAKFRPAPKPVEEPKALAEPVSKEGEEDDTEKLLEMLAGSGE